MTDTAGATRPGPAGTPGPTDWERMFRPRGVAVLGATGRPDSPMARPLRWLAERGFAGAVRPVNPKYDELAGLPCFPSLADVPGPVDLVLAMVPAPHAEAAVREAGAAGAAAVVVFASGFAETGPEGADLQHALVRAGRESGVRVLGPNCQGVIYPPARLFATFTAAADRPLTGTSGIAYAGQSGAVGGSVLDLAAEQGLDLTAWVSTGNQADVDVAEVGRFLVRQPEVSVLAVYLEAVQDGAAYARLAAEAAASGTALVVLRSGRSESGRRAAVSHTGAMLGDDTAFRLVSHRHGVVLVDDVDELLAAATALRGGPRPRGRRIAAVTTSGGAGILAADRCESTALELPGLAPETRAKLARVVPEFGALANPVDVTAQLFNRDDRAFGDVCSIVCADPSVDALMVLLTMVVGDQATDLAEDLAGAMAGTDVPCSVVWLAAADRTTEARATLRRAGIPVFSSIAVAARVAGALAPPATADTPLLPAGDAVPGPAHRPPRTDGWALLRRTGVPAPASAEVRRRDEVLPAARDLAGAVGTVVMKAVAPGLEHKTDAGGVRLGVPVASAADVFDELSARVPELEAVLVQEAVPPGLELLVGVAGARDGWPPVVTVGLGGTATEVHRDVATALVPTTPDEARGLLRELRSWPLLAGHRGAPPRDVDAVVDVLVRLGAAVADRPDIEELEINPLIVGAAGDGVVAVDVLVTTRS
ncbi:acetate--CoA ligase family protein [Pseudonocardia sp. Ae150A_Ps1]|uniref:acetate--CoA ligase family protein n=1 Tax=Pseudonocardia sp. Ae150A_Ps1 TaxID=1885028 RepID=UPI000B29832C|nr:acetate--CoA ligase family protein [Pseudonocardia sp. Ae150A_Ps1]